ncbi:MAG: 4-hydroxy-tetrahydrodipicolinate synthase [Nitrospinae bacterium RIFCSPLOWO2_02_FULL_39_110]|nr:MAG: 4-hydroxy-tetrahydrodipicolinate synthase [Nitrospinae bacterium RIFCSPHIGHO2_02_39_11]OGW00689.1 MAG: 4-hydroxy-tetrahydrodipicolinate synthase [Nitrospinae bacterium RIFCSPHIGHO2_12_FULL_39_42]OGW01724.1 MAG: 4-hydroxy-tetrahydrodipicolinate synthase [Nitrospinae bacterium RIFCSPHIGHO2_02_FULL_39_82]OGW04432.1 MAG: 4-hydroxy-tetrahydrodipicolinate synthase [Nitrospinae bacterium RIFCSPLOWO2_02_39_17]OGW06410.1 MAG: 4-hydroxy-tetrahydrodipicolinate synthase [Nitrospinae bacterium RIFCS
MFKGSFVAIVTPFKDGKIDERAYADLIEFQIEEGTNGIVPCGTTGESATLSHKEHERVVELTVEIANKRVPVIAGTGSNSTSEAIMLTRHAKDAGADASLLITPYYNKPTQEGLYRHFKTIAESVDMPQFLYNVPGRTGVNMLPETVERLSKLKNIIGIKEATGDLKQVSDVIGCCGDNFIILSGDDFTTFPLLAVGGHGVISVTANIAPHDVAIMCKEFFKGNIEKAKEMHYKLQSLNEAMFYETNPIPVKTALSLMGKVSGEMRLPLCPLSEKNLERLKGVMKGYGLI